MRDGSRCAAPACNTPTEFASLGPILGCARQLLTGIFFFSGNTPTKTFLWGLKLRDI
jgi:hypothetical protein